MKKISFILACFLYGQILFGQTIDNTKKFDFGILMGVDFGYLKVEQTNWEDLGIDNEIRSLEAQNKLGFSIGIMGQYHITENFAIAPQAIISFQESRLNYDFENQAQFEQTIEPANVEIPIHFVFTNQQSEKRYSPSAFLGARYIHGLATKDNVDYQLDIKRNDVAIDFGTGVEIKFNKFKMKPELMYSFGLLNLADSNADIYTAAIDHMSRDKISFRLVFYN